MGWTTYQLVQDFFPPTLTRHPSTSITAIATKFHPAPHLSNGFSFFFFFFRSTRLNRGKSTGKTKIRAAWMSWLWWSHGDHLSLLSAHKRGASPYMSIYIWHLKNLLQQKVPLNKIQNKDPFGFQVIYDNDALDRSCSVGFNLLNCVPQDLKGNSIGMYRAWFALMHH